MGAATRRIHVERVEVKTASVSVKTLTLNNKRFTLAVFRQLKHNYLIDADTYQLRGVPWGVVNYFWGRCKEGTHLHVVWQGDKELYRSCESPESPNESSFMMKERQLAEDYAILRFSERCPLPWNKRDLSVLVDEHGFCDVVVDCSPTNKRMHDVYNDAIHDRFSLISSRERDYFTSTYGAVPTVSQFIGRILPPFFADWERDHYGWEKVYRPLESLEQLFIAI